MRFALKMKLHLGIFNESIPSKGNSHEEKKCEVVRYKIFSMESKPHSTLEKQWSWSEIYSAHAYQAFVHTKWFRIGIGTQNKSHTSTPAQPRTPDNPNTSKKWFYF